MKKLGIIGVGKIGEAIIAGLQKSNLANSYEIHGTTRSEESSKEIQKKYKIGCKSNNDSTAQNCKLLFLAVKPHQAKDVLEKMQKNLTESHTIVSLCAALSIEQLKIWSGSKAKIIRAMHGSYA